MQSSRGISNLVRFQALAQEGNMKNPGQISRYDDAVRLLRRGASELMLGSLSFGDDDCIRRETLAEFKLALSIFDQADRLANDAKDIVREKVSK